MSYKYFPKNKKELEKYLTDDDIKIFNQPNVTLAIQYLKTLKLNNININSHLIKRINSNYHDKTINSDIASASAIRNAIENKLPFENTLPKDSLNSLINYPKAQENFINTLDNKLKGISSAPVLVNPPKSSKNFAS